MHVPPGGLVRARLRVAAVRGNRRPLRHHWKWWRCEARKFARAIDDLATHKREHGLQPFNLLLWDGEVIGRQHSEVRELAWHYRSLLVRLTREPRAAHGVQP